MNIRILGIDLAKSVFQLCALDEANQVLWNQSVRRGRLLQTTAQLVPTTIAMEACASAHYWGRVFAGQRHEVILIPPQHVKPFVRGGKNDPRDALAICEAAQRPALHAVPVKTVEQQDLQLLHRLRQQHVQQATALANQIRAVGREYGLVFPTGIKQLLKRLPEALEDASNGLSIVSRTALHEQYQQLLASREAAAYWKRQIVELAQQQPAFAALQTLPGFGPLNASAYLAAIGDGRQFRCGRQVSAWLGLVPRQHGTGGKVRLMGLTKQGDRYLRTLLIHGARAAICRHRNHCKPLADWVGPIIERRGFNKAVVALANKMARIGWVVVSTGAPFELKRAFQAAR